LQTHAGAPDTRLQVAFALQLSAQQTDPSPVKPEGHAQCGPEASEQTAFTSQPPLFVLQEMSSQTPPTSA
jgi:hypothetical protein